MKLYRINLHLRSFLVSRLQSDTIFGSFCWAYRNRYGDKKLEALLDSEEPVAIFSNGFAAGFLPRPVLDPMLSGQRRKIIEKFRDVINKKNSKANKNNSSNTDFEVEKALKSVKKRQFVKKELLVSLRDGLSEAVLVDRLLDEHLSKATEYQAVYEYARDRNIIDRSTGATLDSGGIFAVSEFRYKNPVFDVYALVDESRITSAVFSLLMSDVFEKTGFGADASTGAGSFSVKTEVENLLTLGNEVQSRKHVMSLSNFIPLSEQIDFDSMKYSLVPKFGLLGDSLATARNPYKKPLIMLQAGAVFRPKVNGGYFGAYTRNIHEDGRIVQNTAAIPFYFRQEVGS